MSNIKKNFMYIGIYNMFAMLLPLITSPILSRALGAEALGIYGYVDAVTGIFLVFATTGVYRFGMREIAKVRDNKEKMSQIYSNVLAINMVNILVVIIIYLLFIFTNNSSYELYFLIKLGVLIAAMFDNAFFYCGIENMKPITIRDGVVKLTAFFLILLLVKKPHDLVLYFFIMTMSSLIPAIIGFLYARNFVYFVKPNFIECRRMYLPMVMLIIPMLAYNLYQSMDRIMIGHLFGTVDVGYYLCATKVLVPRSIISALGTAVCPNLTYLYAMGKNLEANLKFCRSLILSLIFSFIVAGVTVVIADDFAPLFWGNDFADCSSLMIGLSITIPIWTVGEVIRSQFLLAKGRDNEYIATFIFGVLINGIVNFALIPIYGAKGAVIGTLAAELSMSILQVYFVRETLSIINYLRQAIPYLLIAVVLSLFIREYLFMFFINRIIRMSSLLIVFCIAYYILCKVYEKYSSSKYMTDLMNVVIRRYKEKLKK